MAHGSSHCVEYYRECHKLDRPGSFGFKARAAKARLVGVRIGSGNLQLMNKRTTFSGSWHKRLFYVIPGPIATSGSKTLRITLTQGCHVKLLSRFTLIEQPTNGTQFCKSVDLLISSYVYLFSSMNLTVALRTPRIHDPLRSRFERESGFMLILVEEDFHERLLVALDNESSFHNQNSCSVCSLSMALRMYSNK